ncbi:flagellar hook assembly protein FlgD [Ramlibacter humi]|uniref:Basal-body rod modification protein FlgD n=1 Tax=Ramlibacter humi TaxID=2530451 RepID=A0A4Z0CDJ0_9BURK|nr:flagellar hook assembly protein FlgD [Ramlibacter humi]TFZ08375.1 flagellar hook assembly protein FlgD [Ramlibacter humi]
MTTVTSPTSATTGTASKVSSLTSAADQEDRFMKLLVAQMKNQDPLNPLDNAQMTSQIAQINTVGGIEKLNTTVASLLSAFNRMQATSATELSGRNVLVEGNQLTLADGQATGGVSLGADADTVKVEVIDATGQAVSTLQLGKTAAGVRSFQWNGQLDAGGTAPEGTYKFRVTATASGKAVDATALAPAQVRAVTTGADGAVQLDLGTGGVKPLDAVQAYL